jgi:N-acetylglutamate synthase-like GNAT family acetyltransferase
VTKPEELIIQDGGAILFASLNGKIVGTVALKKEGEDIYELCKMAVDENARGKRIGLILGRSSTEESKRAWCPPGNSLLSNNF